MVVPFLDFLAVDSCTVGDVNVLFDRSLWFAILSGWHLLLRVPPPVDDPCPLLRQLVVNAAVVVISCKPVLRVKLLGHLM